MESVLLMYYLKLLFVYVSAFTLVACGGGSDDSFIPTNDEKIAEVMLKHFSVYCEDTNSSNCPSYVGSLVTYGTKEIDGYNQKGVYQCSTQLIAPDRVLTNRHCLPNELLSIGADCSKSLNVKFPSTSENGSEESFCDKVIDLSSEAKNAAVGEDWAVLKLKKRLKRGAAVSQVRLLPDKTEVKAFPTFFSTKQHYIDGYNVGVPLGRIEKRECKTSSTNILSNAYFFEHSENLVFTCDEKVISGNSGSGLYSNNKMVGLLNSTVDNSFINELLIVIGVNGSVNKGLIAGGNNLYCINYFNDSNSNDLNECYDFDNSAEDVFILGFSHSLVQTLADQVSSTIFNMNEDTQSEFGEQFNLSLVSEDFSSELVKLFVGDDLKTPESLVASYMNPGIYKIYGHFPECVNSSVVDEELIFEHKSINTSTNSQTAMTVTTRGEIEWDESRLEIIEYALKFVRNVEGPNSEISGYTGSYIRTTNLSALERLENLYSNLLEHEIKCAEARESNIVFIESLNSDCRKRSDLERSIEEIEEDIKITDGEKVYNNEKIIFDNPDLANLRFEIPICE